MSRLARVAAILATLEETNGSPESILYIFCDSNLEEWHFIRGILLEAKLIEINAHYVTLTAKGQETAQKLNAATAKKENV